MPSISDFRASSGSLTSPSPSPPPQPLPSNTRRPPASANTTGLDSSSELSELTEDEQETARHATKPGSPRKDAQRVQRRRRSGIVPEPMWDWVYKSNGRKTQEDEDDDNSNASSSSRSKRPKSTCKRADDTPAGDEEDEEVPLAVKAAAGEPPSRVPGSNVDDDDDASGERAPNGISASDNEDVADAQDAPPLPAAKDTDHGSSPALTEDEDAHDHESDYSNESEEEEQPEETEDGPEDAPEDEEDGDERDEQPKIVDTAPVVPIAPAGSSIMAGQQLIKTPSPSTSPEPEEDRDENETPQPDAAVKDEPIEPTTVAGDAGMAERADLDADPDAEVEAEVEAEEADLDLQPAHRAEALDVLAQIELRFALVREALYVEKMEELALEEAMVMQGIHPEMLHLQQELQIRHDRRLDLAAKRRKHEDDHVTLMRKVEEKGVWSWWKHERDELETEMFAETNRKRRRMEREKRLLDRAPPTYRIPQPPQAQLPAQTISVAELFRLASLDMGDDRASLKRKRIDTIDNSNAYPTLNTLSSHEIQTDLQQLTAPRNRQYPAPMPNDAGVGLGMPPGPPQHYMDYNAPPGSGRTVYHPQQHPVHPHTAPPPMGSIHQPGARPMQGPGAPPPPPPPSSGAYSTSHGHSRPQRRSPSPFDHGGPPINGNTIYGAMNGPGQHWAPVPTSAGATSNIGAGPSKQNVVNGYVKEGRRDGRDREKLERERERERMWHEGNVKDQQMQDEHSRLHGQLVGRSPYPHQVQQSVPHHHHHVHRHNGLHTHHHHTSSSQRVPTGAGRGPNDVEHDHARYPNPADQRHYGSKPHSSGPYWKLEDERERDRARHQAPMSQLGPAPDRDRDRQPSFVMTPSQAIAAGFNGPRPGEENDREQWLDDRERYERDREREREHVDRDRYTQAPPSDGQRPRSHIGTHSRQGSSSNGIRSPRANSRAGKQLLTQSPSAHPIPPPASGPGMGPVPAPPFASSLLHSPARLSQTLGASASPRTVSNSNSSNTERERDRSGSGSGVNGVSPKGIRSISPLPHPKSLPTVYTGTPTGPGTPGSRLGTPGLVGPGTRPSSELSPPSVNGHLSHVSDPGRLGHSGMGLGISHGPGGSLYAGPGSQGLAGPAQSMMTGSPGGGEAGPGHMAPPKMTAVPLGNGS